MYSKSQQNYIKSNLTKDKTQFKQIRNRFQYLDNCQIPQGINSNKPTQYFLQTVHLKTWGLKAKLG